MPHRRRTQSWHSTVAGTLSVHCPSLFLSGGWGGGRARWRVCWFIALPPSLLPALPGAKQLGENGWWSLTSLSPPDPAVAMKSSKGEGRVRRMGGGERGRADGESKRVRLMEPPQVMYLHTHSFTHSFIHPFLHSSLPSFPHSPTGWRRQLLHFPLPVSRQLPPPPVHLLPPLPHSPHPPAGGGPPPAPLSHVCCCRLPSDCQ